MVKFRDLENIYIQIFSKALQTGQLTPQNFAKPSPMFIKANVYDELKLNNVRANQFKNIELKERIRRCAVQYPFQAIRNWLIRNNNLSKIIDQLTRSFSSDKSLVKAFLLGKNLPLQQTISNTLSQNLYGGNQNISYFLIDNMVGQIRNIFLENAGLETVLEARLHHVDKASQPAQKMLKEAILDFFYKKKARQVKLEIEELPAYFLNRYFISLKSQDTRRVKKTLKKEAFKAYRKKRNVPLDRAKEGIKRDNIGTLDEAKVFELFVEAYDFVLKEYQTEPNIILAKHIFKPTFRKSPLTAPTFQGFLAFFKGVLQNKVREHFKELFLTNSIITSLLTDLHSIKQNITTLTKLPEINELSLPIIAKEQIYNDDYANLTIRLSFIQREFIDLKIKDKKGTIPSLISEGALPKVPTITLKRRKLILNLPFDVQKKAVSKQSNGSRKKGSITIGVDLGLKHFAVVSVMDKSKPQAPREIDRYFIGSKQLFDMKFDSTIGKFVYRNRHAYRNPSNIKLKLMQLRKEIRTIQRLKNEYENNHPDFKKKLKFHKLSAALSVLWDKSHNINKEIVRLLNHHIIVIASFHGASKINMENLRFSRHSKKRERGRYLAFWQTHWLFGQIEEAVELQAFLHGMHFERVYAAYTSQRCSECGMIEYKDTRGALVYKADGLSKKERQKRVLSRTKSRDGKQFTCQNTQHHKNKRSFRLDADLSAARNIALA